MLPFRYLLFLFCPLWLRWLWTSYFADAIVIHLPHLTTFHSVSTLNMYSSSVIISALPIAQFCVNEAVDKTSGILLRPSFPEPYHGPLDCTLELRRPPENPDFGSVVVTFSLFNLEECCESLDITDRDWTRSFGGYRTGEASDCTCFRRHFF